MTIAALVLTLALNALPSPAAAAVKEVPACRPQKAAKKSKLRFADGTSIVADVVDTPESREIGLMCRTSLPANYGMLFVFPQQMSLNFWMKNTLVGLDIIWIGADKKVTVVHPRMKASRTDTPDAKIARAGGLGMYVLELPAGAAARHKMKEGDQLEFDAAIPRQ